MKKVDGLFQHNIINERLNQFDQLTQLIEDFMSMPLKNRVWPLLRGRRLVLMTDDPHLATQVRFMEKPLCNHISKNTQLRISGADIKLMSIPLARNDRKLNRNKISAQTAEILSSIAESIEDEEVQSALKRLANQTEANT